MNKSILFFVALLSLVISVNAAIVCTNVTSCVETNLNITISTSVVNNQTFLNILNSNNNVSVVVSNNITVVNNNQFNFAFNNSFSNMVSNFFNFTSYFNNNVSVFQSLNNNVTVTIRNNVTNVVSNTNSNQVNISIHNNNTNIFNAQNNVTVNIFNNATFINTNRNNISLVTKVNVTNLYTNRYYFNTSLSCPAITTGACAPVINVPACPTPRINVTNIFSFPQGVTPATPTNASIVPDKQTLMALGAIGLLIYLIYRSNKKKQIPVVVSKETSQLSPPPDYVPDYSDPDLDSNINRLLKR